MNQLATTDQCSTGFESLKLSPSLLELIADLGYQTMTPIQAQAIPPLMAGRDLIGQSKTGSGKTLAFGIPIIEKVSVDNRALQSLVLCPTRELCTQVAREIRKLGRRTPGLQVQILAGGTPLRAQLSSMTNGMQIAVATPGRLLDHIKRKTVSLESVKLLVLDEADRMLDMGFADDIGEIIAQTPAQRQTVYFSATFDARVSEMSRSFQHKPVRITVEDPAEQPLQIEQTFYEVENEIDKSEALQTLISELNPQSALVFCRLKITAAGLAKNLYKAGFSTRPLHGDLDQAERDRAMAMFRNGSARILVATDVAARGLDVIDLDLVVNFDLPSDSEVYLHRIGRTGRAGKSGMAINLGIHKERNKLDQYQRLTGTPIQRLMFSDRMKTTALQSNHNSAEQQSPAPAGLMSTLHIWGGRKDKLRPGDILGALTGELGMAFADVGKIEILDRLSYVAVASHLAKNAARRLRDGHIKGRKFRVDVLG
jgi:ATP-dependent RNA helicase DbpA